MAKLLFLLAALVVAAAVVAEANVSPPVAAPAPPPAATYPTGKFSLKLILHNVVDRNVTFKLVTPVVSKPVVALPNTWNAIAPALLSTKRRTIGVSVTVKTDKHVSVTKIFTIYLLKHFKASELKGEKFLALTAVKSWSWKSKYLLITIGDDVVLSIKL